MNEFSRLSLVANILKDRALIELRQENERLKLTIFWHDHNIYALREAMERANLYHPDAPKCMCIHCSYSGRCGNQRNQIDSCKFKPWFEAKLQECGLETLNGYPEGGKQTPHKCSGETNFVLDADIHFVNMSIGYWTWFTYGSKLWAAKSLGDPQIQKLVLLFKELNKDDWILEE